MTTKTIDLAMGTTQKAYTREEAIEYLRAMFPEGGILFFESKYGDDEMDAIGRYHCYIPGEQINSWPVLCDISTLIATIASQAQYPDGSLAIYNPGQWVFEYLSMEVTGRQWTISLRRARKY